MARCTDMVARGSSRQYNIYVESPPVYRIDSMCIITFVVGCNRCPAMLGCPAHVSGNTCLCIPCSLHPYTDTHIPTPIHTQIHTYRRIYSPQLYSKSQPHRSTHLHSWSSRPAVTLCPQRRSRKAWRYRPLAFPSKAGWATPHTVGIQALPIGRTQGSCPMDFCDSEQRLQHDLQRKVVPNLAHIAPVSTLRHNRFVPRPI